MLFDFMPVIVQVKQWKSMLNQWNRLRIFDSGRLNKRVLNSSYVLTIKSFQTPKTVI